MTPAAEQLLKFLWDKKHHYASALFAEVGAEYLPALQELEGQGYRIDADTLQKNGARVYRLRQHEVGSVHITLRLPIEDVEALVLENKVTPTALQHAAEALNLSNYPFGSESASTFCEEDTQFSIPLLESK